MEEASDTDSGIMLHSAALKEERKLKELENTLNECRLLAGRRPLPTSGSGDPATEEPSASDESSLSDAVLPEEEETPPSRPAPPAPDRPTATATEGRPHSPARSWKETSLDQPYEKAGKPGADASGDAAGSLAPRPPRPGEMPPYHSVPVRSLVLCRRLGSSAPSTPEPPGRRGQCPSLRADGCWEPAEPRGRGALPRRRPTCYTVTVPAYCFPPPGPAYRSGSDDSNSDGSGISHAASPGGGDGGGSPAGSCRRPPAAEPPHAACCSRGAPRLPGAFRYEQDLAPLRYQRLVPSHSRIVRTPSLKDYAPGAGRGLSKAAVSEELQSWHQRARLRGARPHSLDRQGALRGRGGPGRETYPVRGSQPRTQVFQTQALKRSPDGLPAQLYLPENGEIVTQV
ncbi:innate immunity activator protein [Apteryx rowi]|uniref:innate immunity activator protein n=1 Tax=Apteryx rowi TaxID=308060 RepID=UPI000E1DAA64|nr:innate immunity activator protein [Apteryx rowi]